MDSHKEIGAIWPLFFTLQSRFMERFFCVYTEWVDGVKSKRYKNILADDVEQALFKWSEDRAENQFLESIKQVPLSED